ncbi:PAS domain S-box protein [Ktedonobacter sp. SOSP1-85]|uniref:PAS domain S-box protein n=1 Tax=Ktedonobacter sp. SOSP1-85 TaxID=2778367 RepID=UPI00191554FB|nr:PAS domain S-box protein [Ktedonobacter sp. SOSP1-85]
MGAIYEHEGRIRHGQTGEYRWFFTRGVPMRDEAGQIVKWFGTSTDITERKRAEAEIHALVDTIPQFVWIAAPDGLITYSNHRLINYLAMTLEQVQGDGWLAGLHPDDRPRTREAWQTSIQTGMPYEVEHRVQDGTSGGYRWFLVRGVPQRNTLGTILHWVGTCTDIEDQKQAEQKIKASEENLRVLAEMVPQLVWTKRPDGQFAYTNQRWRDYTGSTLEQLQSDQWAHLQFLHPDDHEGNRAHWLHALDTGDMFEYEQRLRNAHTGEYRWFLVRAMPVRDEVGQIVKWFGTSTDIDEQKRAEQQLKESEQNLRVLAETVPQLVWTARPDGLSDYWNQRFCAYTHATREQLYGYGWSQFVHPEDYTRTLAVRERAFRTGVPYEVEHRFREGQTGRYRWFLARAMPVRDETGQIVKWFGTSTDIEDQKRTEQRLKESREHFRVLAEMVPQLVWTARPDGRVDYCNQRYCDLTQADFEQIRDYRWRQFLHPEDAEHTLALRQQSLATGELFENEQRLRDGRTGEYRWYLTRALPVRDEAGQIIKWFGTSTDIDDQKRIEEALRQSQERANALMNSNIIGINIIEGEQIVDANDTFLRMTGYTREDLRAGNMNWMQMTPSEYRALTQQAHQQLTIQHYITPYEKEYVCKDGSRLPVLVGAVLLQHPPNQAIAFVLDNSARKELEQRKDAFISMASHELKTPLTALKMQAQLARKRLERQSPHEAATALSRVEGPIQQLERLIGELLDVSKIQAGRLEYLQEAVDLDMLLHEVADTMQQISTTHTIVVRGATLCSLEADKGRLEQVFINLISNAIKYSPDAKTVEIDLSTSPEAATIRIRDHGQGIPQELRDKIFERFYRVSGANQKAIPGLGMGLYIVAEIVRHHGGDITVESEVGKGSTFSVTLPLERSLKPGSTSVPETLG